MTTTTEGIAKQAMRHFLMPLERDTFFNSLESAIGGLATPLKSCGASFRHNLDAVLSTVAVPAQIAITYAQESRFQQLHIAERIRARSDVGADGQPTAVVREFGGDGDIPG